MSNNQILFIDGFGKPEYQVRYWEPDLYARESGKVSIFKLHGSVDWFRFRPEGGDWSDESIGIPSNGDPEDTRDSQGRRQFTPDNRPMMLIGTTNKVLEYVRPFYTDLLSQFYCSARNSGRLVICGYGFGDREWLGGHNGLGIPLNWAL